MLGKNQYLIKSHSGHTYDIIDPEKNKQIGIVKEKISVVTIMLRLLSFGAFAAYHFPTKIVITDIETEKPIFSIVKGVTLFRSQTQLTVIDSNNNELGRFKTKASLLSIGGGFEIYDKNGKMVAEVKGEGKGNFKFIDASGTEMGVITPQQEGFAKELFKSGNDYMISITTANKDTAVLVLAAGLANEILFYN